MLLGAGTALVYPTLIAAMSDAVTPVARAPVVGVYRYKTSSKKLTTFPNVRHDDQVDALTQALIYTAEHCIPRIRVLTAPMPHPLLTTLVKGD